MRPEIRALISSTILVIAYPIAAMIVLAPFAILWGGPYIDRALKAMMLPMRLPFQIMDFLYPNAPILRRPVLFILVWFFAFNATIYYVPIRLFLQWREGKLKLR